MYVYTKANKSLLTSTLCTKRIMNPTAFIVCFTLILSFSSLRAATTDVYRYVYVTPKEESKCPSSAQPCYTLTQINENPTEYFLSNTTVVLLPGTHTANSTSDTAIQDVDNIALVGSAGKVSRVQCTETGKFGLAFINVTNLTVSNIWMSDCSAPLLWKEIKWHISLSNFHSKWLYEGYDMIYNEIPATLYMIQVSDAKISTLKISNSRGVGLLGINVFGNTSITNSSFTRNEINCYFQFMDADKYLVHTVLHLEDTNFEWGKMNNFQCAAGLTIVMAQSTYTISVKIINVTAYGNKGVSSPHGNVLIRFDECNNYQIEIIIQGLNCSRPTHISNWDDTDYKENGMDLNGGLSLTDSNCSYYQHPIQISNSFFSHNRVAVSILNIKRKLVIFENVTIYQNRENILHCFSVFDSDVQLKNTNFSHNTFMADIIHSTIIFHNTHFFNNTGERGALYADSSNVKFQGNTTVIKNKGKIGGAIYLKNSTLILEGSIEFLENEGYDGGAIAFHSESMLMVGPHSNIKFTGNHAQHQGGAIYVYDLKDSAEIFILRSQEAFTFPQITCFYQAHNKDTISIAPVVLENNTANDAGSAVFGGWVDFCDGKWLFIKWLLFDTMFKITDNLTDLSQISSTPIIVCICFNSTPNCTNTNVHTSAYPGETFYISAVAVGQRLGIIPTIIRSAIVPVQSAIPSTLETLQYSQKVGRVCTKLSYTVRSLQKQETIILSVDESVHQSIIEKDKDISETELPDIFIHLYLKHCPKGFVFDNSSCICDPVLQKHAISCDINNQRIHRQPSFWIYTIESEETPSGSLMGNVLVHEHCPFDYCKPYSLNLSLESPDEQCAFNRSGILCGACQHSLSHVLGSSNCKECSSLWLILFIPAFALAGIILVIFLMVLNLTVPIGTINGLIFYANIVRANHAIFFTHSTSNSFLSWFIAWVNLDLGIETCFYSGFDAYAKTWLQFIFPIYIWLVVIIIIVSSHYYTMAAKLAGRNSVKVLATLFLLSYAKLLRVTIAILSSTTLECPDGSVRRVWLYDGNVDYLKGKHVPLFMAALLVLLVLSLPYTALLLFIQCLQLKSNYRALFWIGKFKPLFDAYTGPYKDKHRYWTGLLLLVRAVLFLIFSVNVFGDPAINLLVVLLAILLLLVKLAFYGGIYKATYLNALEYSFLLNLGLLSSCTLYNHSAEIDQKVFTHISTSIAFATFIAVIFYHAVIRMGQLGWFRNVTAKAFIVKLGCCCPKPNPNSATERLPNDTNRHTPPRQVPVSFIELREPLLEHCT